MEWNLDWSNVIVRNKIKCDYIDVYSLFKNYYNRYGWIHLFEILYLDKVYRSVKIAFAFIRFKTWYNLVSGIYDSVVFLWYSMRNGHL